MRPAPADALRSSGLCRAGDLPAARVRRACDSSQTRPAVAPASASTRLFRPASAPLAPRLRPFQSLVPEGLRDEPRPQAVLRPIGNAIRTQSRSCRIRPFGFRARSFVPECWFLEFVCEAPAQGCLNLMSEMLAAADGLAEGARHIGHRRNSALVLTAHVPANAQRALSLVANHIRRGDQR